MISRISADEEKCTGVNSPVPPSHTISCALIFFRRGDYDDPRVCQRLDGRSSSIESGVSTQYEIRDHSLSRVYAYATTSASR